MLVCVCVAAGCTTPPPTIGDGFITGAGFVHRVDVQGRLTNAARVHVYLEGDGRPFVTRHRPAPDPTPRRRLALELMRLDRSPSVYLARPCYEGEAASPPCAPSLWTAERYGERVVASLAAALDGLRSRHRIGHFTLIGYSGGGVLAMLLAERVPSVDRVVTMAANLDIEAWAALHGYSPLEGSLNPARRPALPARVRQWHYAGGRDRIVPSALIAAAVSAQPGARVVVVDAASHARGWTSVWPLLLATELATDPP